MLEQGQLIGGRYIIQHLIAEGGFAAVYCARDTMTDNLVALKQMHREIAELEPENIARFERETNALRLLNHPNIVTIFDNVREDGNSYVVMEYVSGGDLANFIVRYRQQDILIPITQVMNITLKLGDALTYAHTLGIIHRDIKPANVLMTTDHAPRLTDFGMARLADSIRLTRSGVMIGTLGYLSPEAVNGEDIDHHADIWSFGVMMYELLALERPFDAPNIAAVLTGIVSREPVPLAQLRPDAPRELCDIIHTMLNKDIDKRPSDIRAVWEYLQSLASVSGVN